MRDERPENEALPSNFLTSEFNLWNTKKSGQQTLLMSFCEWLIWKQYIVHLQDNPFYVDNFLHLLNKAICQFMSGSVIRMKRDEQD